MKKLFYPIALTFATTFASAAFAAEPKAGSLDAAKALALQFLPMVSAAGVGRFDISTAIERDGKVTVNAGEQVGDRRQSCSVTMVRHPSANKRGWVVEAYACAVIKPGQ